MKAKPSPKPGRAGGKALAKRDGPHSGRKLRAAPTTAPATHTASLTPTPPAPEPEDCEFPDPEAANHALLVLIHEDEEAAQLRPCDIEKQTGIRHQHQLKMRPMLPEEGKEALVSSTAPPTVRRCAHEPQRQPPNPEPEARTHHASCRCPGGGAP